MLLYKHERMYIMIMLYESFFLTCASAVSLEFSDRNSDTPLMHRVKHMMPLSCNGSWDWMFSTLHWKTWDKKSVKKNPLSCRLQCTKHVTLSRNMTKSFVILIYIMYITGGLQSYSPNACPYLSHPFYRWFLHPHAPLAGNYCFVLWPGILC